MDRLACSLGQENPVEESAKAERKARRRVSREVNTERSDVRRDGWRIPRMLKKNDGSMEAPRGKSEEEVAVEVVKEEAKMQAETSGAQRMATFMEVSTKVRRAWRECDLHVSAEPESSFTSGLQHGPLRSARKDQRADGNLRRNRRARCHQSKQVGLDGRGLCGWTLRRAAFEQTSSLDLVRATLPPVQSCCRARHSVHRSNCSNHEQLSRLPLEWRKYCLTAMRWEVFCFGHRVAHRRQHWRQAEEIDAGPEKRWKSMSSWRKLRSPKLDPQREWRRVLLEDGHLLTSGTSAWTVAQTALNEGRGEAEAAELTEAKKVAAAEKLRSKFGTQDASNPGQKDFIALESFGCPQVHLVQGSLREDGGEAGTGGQQTA